VAPVWWELLLLVGLTARLTRLVTVDTIARPAVERAVYEVGRRRHNAGWWLGQLLDCPFCIGFWLSAGVVGSWLLWGGTVVWQAVAAVFTLSYVAGHLVAALDFADDGE
jgi:hypothetical protein